MDASNQGGGVLQRVGVLGAGQAFKKMLPGLRRWFAIAAIYDPDEGAIGWQNLEREERSARVLAEDEFFDRASVLDAILILSPPAHHVRQLERASALPKPVFVEKPLAVDADGLLKTDAVIAANSQIYFSCLYADVRGALLI